MILSILQDITLNGSTNEKLKILDSHKDNELLKRVYRLTYHPQIQFGIKKIPFFDRNRSEPTASLTEAMDFLETRLAKREVTGNSAIELLSDMLCEMRSDDAEVICRIIKRDLACGASSTMANKVWKGLIPVQPQMLAQPYSEKTIAKIKYPAMAQLKADGARCFAEIRGYENYDDVRLLSRQGNEYQNIFALKDELMAIYKTVADKYPEGITIDGELVFVGSVKKETSKLDFFNKKPVEESKTNVFSVESRQVSNGIANKALKGTITDEEAKGLSFQVWDYYSLDTAYGDKTSDTAIDRYTELGELVKGNEKVLLIPNTIVHNVEEARTVYQNYLDAGLEGIILKNLLAVWENKRSVNQVKFKDVIDVDLRIVGFTLHSKDPNKIGSFKLESDCKRIRVNSGSGLRDTDSVKTNELDENDQPIWVPIPMSERHELNRAKLFTEIEKLITDGVIVELECNGYTTAEGRTDCVSLFLPIIKRLRFDKNTTNTFAERFPDSKLFKD